MSKNQSVNSFILIINYKRLTLGVAIRTCCGKYYFQYEKDDYRFI